MRSLFRFRSGGGWRGSVWKGTFCRNRAGERRRNDDSDYRWLGVGGPCNWRRHVVHRNSIWLGLRQAALLTNLTAHLTGCLPAVVATNDFVQHAPHARGWWANGSCGLRCCFAFGPGLFYCRETACWGRTSGCHCSWNAFLVAILNRLWAYNLPLPLSFGFRRRQRFCLIYGFFLSFPLIHSSTILA